jgi:hypothetical protein
MASAHHGAAAVYRPRPETAHWSAAATLGCAVLAIGTRDATYLFPAATCFALLLQCGQRIVVDGPCVQRFGLRPAVVDLTTATIAGSGTAWWRELFLCGRPFQLRDAHGGRLYLESWLWPAELRAVLVEAVGEALGERAHP